MRRWVAVAMVSDTECDVVSTTAPAAMADVPGLLVVAPVDPYALAVLTQWLAQHRAPSGHLRWCPPVERVVAALRVIAAADDHHDGARALADVLAYAGDLQAAADRDDALRQ